MVEETKESPKNKAPKDLMGMLNYYLVEKAPFQIPNNAKEWIVQYGPWIMVAVLILTAPALLAAIGLFSFFVPFAGLYGAGLGISTILALVVLGLQAAALPGLFNRKVSGWNMLFYAEAVYIFSGLVSTVSGYFGSLISTAIGAVISLYVLFQIRSYYK